MKKLPEIQVVEEENLAKHRQIYRIKREKDGYKIKFSKPGVIEFLISRGFYRVDIDIVNPKKQKAQNFYLVQVVENKIRYVTQESIVMFFYKYLETFEPYNYNVETYQNEAGELLAEFIVTSQMLYNQLVYTQSHIFDKNLFILLEPPKPIKIKQDTKSDKFFYFNNCVVRCTAKGYETLDYKDLTDGFVLPTRILNRDFVPVPDVLNNFEPSTDAKNPSPNFTQFLYYVSGQDFSRYKSLLSIIGYLMHEYTGNKKLMIIFTDTGISENGEPDGRRGKGMVQRAISRMMNHDVYKDTVYYQIDGKTLDPVDPVSYGRADENTKVICIDDVHKKYANTIIEDMFVRIEQFTVKSLYYDYIDIQVKVLISSNIALFVGGGSAKDRTIFFLFSDFYKSGFSPEDHFGERFWEHWTETHHNYKWHQFDSEMIKAQCLYLSKGIIKPDLLDFNLRMIMDRTTGDSTFVDFMEALLNKETIYYTSDKGLSESFTLKISDNLYYYKLSDLPIKGSEAYNRVRDNYSRVNRDEIMKVFIAKADKKFTKDWFSKKMFTMWVKLYIDEVAHGFLLDIYHSGADYFYTFYKRFFATENTKNDNIQKIND